MRSNTEIAPCLLTKFHCKLKTQAGCMSTDGRIRKPLVDLCAGTDHPGSRAIGIAKVPLLCSGTISSGTKHILLYGAQSGKKSPAPLEEAFPLRFYGGRGFATSHSPGDGHPSGSESPKAAVGRRCQVLQTRPTRIFLASPVLQ